MKSRNYFLYIGSAVLLVGGLMLLGIALIRICEYDWTLLRENKAEQQASAEAPRAAAAAPAGDTAAAYKGISEGKGDDQEPEFSETVYSPPEEPADTGVVYEFASESWEEIDQTPLEKGQAGVTKVSKVKLSDDVLKLAEQGHYPQVGDHLHVMVSPTEGYSLKICQIIPQSDQYLHLIVRDTDSYHAVPDVMFCNRRIVVKITDWSKHRSYSLSFNPHADSYVIVETDLTKVPTGVLPCEE